MTAFFSTNAKLFQKIGSGWTDRGTGPFKLNYRTGWADEANPEEESEESYTDGERRWITKEARFIMRSAATHKVTLNARIFKEMIVGDHNGGEPPKRNELLFSAAGEKGIEIYLLRVSFDPVPKHGYLLIHPPDG